MSRITALIFALTIIFPLMADEKLAPDSRVKDISPFIDEQTILVLHVDVSRIKAEDLMAEVVKIVPIPAKEAQRAKEQAGSMLESLNKLGLKDFYFVFSLADLTAPLFMVVPLAPDADIQAI